MSTNDLTVAIARHLESAGWHDAADYVRGDYITGKVSELMPPDLTDPAVVHANMLRGSIAKLTVDQVKHLYPDLCAYGQVQVLALEWQDDAPFFGDDPDSVIYSEAEGAGYTYVAEAVDCTLEEAKAACQAEFERRIIAALTPAPQPEGQVRALEWFDAGHGIQSAGTPFGTISIEPTGHYGGAGYIGGKAPNMDAAKAAAQADYERRILAALTPAPQVDAEHCGCGDKACLACFPAATPTAQEAVPVNQPQPNMSVAEAAEVLLGDSAAIKTLVDFQLRHSASASDKARSMRHVQVVAALRALKGHER